VAGAQSVITVVDNRGTSTQLSNAGIGYIAPGSPTMAYSGSWVVFHGGNRKENLAWARISGITISRGQATITLRDGSELAAGGLPPRGFLRGKTPSGAEFRLDLSDIRTIAVTN